MTKILLVEDNELNRDMLSRWLARRGYEVVLAGDGEEALVKARSEKPNVVLMDLGLPKLDGWEATRRLKSMPDTRHLPVIALTGYVTAADRARALGAGCDDFDVKPVDIERLIMKIELLVGPTSAAQQVMD